MINALPLSMTVLSLLALAAWLVQKANPRLVILPAWAHSATNFPAKILKPKPLNPNLSEG